MKPPAVLGIGNEYRGDDAAGLLVVRALRAADAAQDWDLLELSGEGAGLIDAWEERPCVVLVDAVALAGSPAGTVLRYDDPTALPPDTELRCSSHAFGRRGAGAGGSARQAAAGARALRHQRAGLCPGRGDDAGGG